MTVSTTSVRVSYSGNGSATAFAVNFPFLLDADLKVILTVDSTGVETVQTLITHYTLVGAGTGTGTLTMVTAPAVGETLTIIGDPDPLQPLDLADNDALPAEEVEKAFDRTALIVQRSLDKTERSFKLAESDTGSADIPAAASRASKYFAFDATGNPIASSGPTGASNVPVSAFMETLLDDSNAATARTTLGLTPSAIAVDNLVATTFPGVGDDSGDGYSVGSRWLHTTYNAWYMCVDASVGAAVWKLMNSFAFQELADITGAGTYVVSGLPSGVASIELAIRELSVSAAATLRLQIGDSGGMELGLVYEGGYTEDNTSSGFSTSGFLLGLPAATADALSGSVKLTYMGLTGGLGTWAYSSVMHAVGGAADESWVGSGQVVIDTGGAGVLTQFQVAASAGTLDGGTMTTRIVA